MESEKVIAYIKSELTNWMEDNTIPMDRQLKERILNLLQSIEYDIDAEGKFECNYCWKETDGLYVDRGMNFCNPTCAVKQAEQKD